MPGFSAFLLQKKERMCSFCRTTVPSSHYSPAPTMALCVWVNHLSKVNLSHHCPRLTSEVTSSSQLRCTGCWSILDQYPQRTAEGSKWRPGWNMSWSHKARCGMDSLTTVFWKDWGITEPKHKVCQTVPPRPACGEQSEDLHCRSLSTSQTKEKPSLPPTTYRKST